LLILTSTPIKIYLELRIMLYIKYPDALLAVVFFFGISALVIVLYDLVRMERHFQANEKAWDAVVIRLGAIERKITQAPRSTRRDAMIGINTTVAPASSSAQAPPSSSAEAPSSSSAEVPPSSSA